VIADTVQEHRLGDFPLDGGGVLPDARIVYRVIGSPDGSGGNCIVLPTYYTGSHTSYDAMIGAGKALDPARWCIVIPNMFGNGHSTSPSNWNSTGPFPAVSIADNVRAQHRVLEEALGVTRLALAAGWSMGAMQAWGWAALYPDAVERLLPWCGGARCWPLNRVFLEGVRAALLADPAPGRSAGLRAFGRAYAGWAFSAQFFREELWRGLGFDSLEAFLTFWEDDHAKWHPEDLLTMLETWRTADLTDKLPRVRARTLVMPCDTDSYFTEAENRLEAGLVPGAQVRTIRSAAGHCAGAPGRFPAETTLIDAALRELLADA
jgi:homoserine O-acetyltransferase